jgi:hypothetical protein
MVCERMVWPGRCLEVIAASGHSHLTEHACVCHLEIIERCLADGYCQSAKWKAPHARPPPAARRFQVPAVAGGHPLCENPAPSTVPSREMAGRQECTADTSAVHRMNAAYCKISQWGVAQQAM